MNDSDEMKRRAFRENMKWLSENFRSYGLLSRLLKAQPKFISMALGVTDSLSIKSMVAVGIEMGLNEDEIFTHRIEEFKQSSEKWIEKQIKIINKRKDSK